MLSVQRCDDDVEERRLQRGRDAERLRDRFFDGSCAPGASQFDQPHAIPPKRTRVFCHAQCEPRLANAFASDERDEPMGGRKGADFGDDPLATDECRKLGRQVVPERCAVSIRVANRSERRPVGGGFQPHTVLAAKAECLHQQRQRVAVRRAARAAFEGSDCFNAHPGSLG